MEQNRRGQEADRRNRSSRRGATPDRRKGAAPVLGDKRTRFSILYFMVAFVVLVALNYVLGRASTRQVPYSELKHRIEAGQIKHVVIGPNALRGAVPWPAITNGSS